MFEEIVEKKYNPLKIITGELKTISLDTIKNSDLPLYAINFIFAEQTEINDKNTLNTLLEKSVKLIVNYSLRPKWTIANYFFGGFDSKPADEILRKAEVFRFYRYYIDLITNHINDNALMFLTQEEVKYLTDEANKVVLEKLVKNTSSVKIKNFFSQVYKLKYGDDKEINLDWSVPFLFIKLFLEDKGFTELLEKFSIIPGLDDTMEIEMKTAIKVLTGKYYVNGDFFVLKDQPKKTDTENEITEAGQEKQEETVLTEKIIHPEKIDITSEIKTEEKISETIPVKTVSEEEDKPKGIIRIIKNIPTKKMLRKEKIISDKSTKTAEENKTVQTEIPPSEKEIYVKKEKPHGEEKLKYLFKQEEIIYIRKKIFKDSKSAMYEAFGELESFVTWQEASDYLKEIFLKNKVDLYNKYTVLFVDLLNDHFSKIGKGK